MAASAPAYLRSLSRLAGLGAGGEIAPLIIVRLLPSKGPETKQSAAR
jgi:hypothetical protein